MAKLKRFLFDDGDGFKATVFALNKSQAIGLFREKYDEPASADQFKLISAHGDCPEDAVAGVYIVKPDWPEKIGLDIAFLNEELKSETIEFLRLRANAQGETLVHGTTLFVNPRDFGAALGQAILNMVGIYSTERTRSGDPTSEDYVRGQILAGVYETVEPELTAQAELMAFGDAGTA